MPKYSIHTAVGMEAFYPTLKELFIDNEMLHVCKMNHTEENCRMGTGLALSGLNPNLHVIFLNADLEPTMRNIVNYLIQHYPSEDPEDPNNFVNCILMCPGCGKRFADQHNRNCRSS